MDASTREALSLLAALRAAAIPRGPVALSPLYLRRVARVETLPANQPGADKTWVAQALSRFRAPTRGLSVEGGLISSIVRS